MAVFNEDTRVKIPATIQLLRLGYNYQSLKDDDLIIDFNTKIFINRFKPAIEKINGKKLNNEEMEALLADIHGAIKNNDLGKEFYIWLINPQDRLKLIDFDDIENNDFAVVDELPFSVKEGTEVGSFRPDVNILINGMPLGFLEVKKPNNEGGIQKEFERMIDKRFKNPEYKKFFNLIQFISFSNNMDYEDDDTEDVKAGSFYTTPNGNKTTFSFFREDEKNYHEDYPYIDIPMDTVRCVTSDCGYNPSEVDAPEFAEDLKTTTPCNRFITSVFDKERFLYFLKYGMMYVDGRVPEKHIMRYPQFFATRKIIERLESGGKGGIIWHTQGSGKTDLAAFSVSVLRDYYAKKNITSRLFFVVDRLDLLIQASKEFACEGLRAVNCNNKSEFTKELNKTLSTNTGMRSTGEICVVNIQKFEGKMPEAKNDYNANVQRVFFVDEAHRSYSSTGEFFKNLMTCDTDAVYIALTGTPLLSKKERSNLKFGDYIHKYFYDKSIADGYTLRIKKEDIDTVAKAEIRMNLDIEGGKADDKAVFESDDYVNSLGKYIEMDFENFRHVNTDPSIGGMIVCRSNAQAKKLHQWFKDNSDFVVGLVISDTNDPMQRQINKDNQLEFQETLSPDILVVSFMLTTGYNVKRLKKMYLLRGPHSHTLLQTISRVNRPYISPNGRTYKYGYIVDFVDIADEYNKTLEAYIKELEDDLNDNGENDGSLDGLVIDKDDINKKYQMYLGDLGEIISINNMETFSKQLTRYDRDDRETLLKIRHLLNGIKDCYTEFVLSQATDYAKQIDIDKIKKLIRTTQERLDFVGLTQNSVDMLSIISDDEVVNILYEFIKVKISILDLSQISEDNPKLKNFTDTVKRVQHEVKRNKNRDDIQIKKLDELLQKIFNDLSVSDLEDIDSITDELKEALEKAQAINDENERLSKAYGGNYAFVKTFQDAAEEYPVDRSVLETVMEIIYDKNKDALDSDIIAVQGRKNFVNSVKQNATRELMNENVHSCIKEFYTELLNDLYTNIQLFK